MVRNLARKKFIASFVLALIKSRNVQFWAIAQHLNPSAKVSSNEVRIQDFFREVSLNYAQVGRLLLSFLPMGQKLRLCLDRTEWDFGVYQVNILMVTVGYQDLALPLFWELLDNKSGNSGWRDRCDLLDKCVALLGKDRIGVVIGDREFIGHRWFKYLKTQGIQFVMRMPKSHHIHQPDGRVLCLKELKVRTHEPRRVSNCLVDGVVGNVWVKQQAEGDWLFLFGNIEPKYMGQIYRKRWTIEACFQNLKGRGFDLEKTHLKSAEKLKKLIALVSITYGICVSVGQYGDRKIKRIPRKNHGYKAKSFARKGIDLICEWFRVSNIAPEIQRATKLFCRYIKLNLYLCCPT